MKLAADKVAAASQEAVKKEARVQELQRLVERLKAERESLARSLESAREEGEQAQNVLKAHQAEVCHRLRCVECLRLGCPPSVRLWGQVGAKRRIKL